MPQKGLSMKTLNETVDLMLSDRWEDRLVAEYWQTKIRYNALHKTLVKLDAGTTSLSLTDKDQMRNQKRLMGEYLYQIEVRAEREGIDLDVEGR